MRAISVFMALLAVLAGCAALQAQIPVVGWRRPTLAKLILIDAAVNAVDVATSVYDQHRYRTTEDNPLFGKHPRDTRFVAQYSVQLGAFYAAALLVGRRHQRIAKGAVMADMFLDAYCVRNNFAAMRQAQPAVGRSQQMMTIATAPGSGVR